MAEGGDFGMDKPDLDHRLDYDDDDDDDDDDVQEPSHFSLARFPPPTMVVNNMKCKLCSTNRADCQKHHLMKIYLCWVALFIKMINQLILKDARAFIKRRFPRVDFGKLGPIGFSKKPGNDTTIVSFGTRGGETEIFRKDGKGLLQKFKDKFKTSLGPEAESLIAQDNDEIRENRQRLREAEKQLKEAKKLASEREKAAQEVQDLRTRID